MKDPVRILKDWIEKEGRKQTWVAQQVGCSPQWLNYVLKGKKPVVSLYSLDGVPHV